MNRQRRLRANVLGDVTVLAMCLQTTPANRHADILAVAHDLDIMRFRGLFFPVLARLLKKRRGRQGLRTFFARYQARKPDAVRAFMDDFTRHVLQGTDTEDADSVGGLSQREIDAFQANVTFSILDEASQ